MLLVMAPAIGEVHLMGASKVSGSLLIVLVAMGVLVAPSGLFAAPPGAQWVWCMQGAAGASSFLSVARDGAGNVYAAGTIVGVSNPFDLGNGVAVKGITVDHPNALLVRFSHDGNALWARSPVDAADGSAFASLCVDSSGSVYAAGSIGEGRVDFGNGVTATGTGNRDSNAVLVKYDSSGAAQWARAVTASTGESGFSAVAADSSGNVYVVGYIRRGIFEFGDDVSVSGGPSSSISAILLRYDPSGKVQWARAVPTGAGDRWRVSFASVAIDLSGSVYVAGYCGSESFDFGNGVTVKAPALWHALLVKYDPGGNAQWARISDSNAAGSAWYNSVAVDNSGNIVAAGLCQMRMEYGFGGGVTILGVPRDRNPVLVKYDAQGTALWARTIAEATSPFPDAMSSWGFTSVTTDTAGDIFVLGEISSTSTVGFGNGVRITGVYYGTTASATSSRVAGRNALVVKYDGSGDAQWARTVSAASANSVYTSLALDATGNFYAVGWIGISAVAFAPGVTAEPKAFSNSNAVLVKYEER